jgi:2-iminobutanoate/2-iminopropanoate deaminase
MMYQQLYNQMKINKVLIYLIMTASFFEAKSQTIQTDSVYQTLNLGFSQAITSNGIVYTSGIVGWDTHYKLTGNGNFEDQSKQCFKNLENILEATNSSMVEVIHIRIYVTEMTEENKLIITNILKLYYPTVYKPATTLLCIKSLARDNLKIEIESVSNIKK